MLKKAPSFVLVHPLHEAWQRVPVRRSTVLGTHCSRAAMGSRLFTRCGLGTRLAGAAVFLNILGGSLRS